MMPFDRTSSTLNPFQTLNYNLVFHCNYVSISVGIKLKELEGPLPQGQHR